MRLFLLPLFVMMFAGCPKAKTETQTPTPKTTTPEKKPITIGPDECCCPFASAEAIDFNISPKKDCEEQTGCVEDARCME